ncbi:MAG: hypothetical protein J3K34DRAFT_408942 [Monoraphidium minutum]|nr:MAG: hypothetical protein J3K34DRAFT_408942 [Monoraphidium minutum]
MHSVATLRMPGTRVGLGVGGGELLGRRRARAAARHHAAPGGLGAGDGLGVGVLHARGRRAAARGGHRGLVALCGGGGVVRGGRRAAGAEALVGGGAGGGVALVGGDARGGGLGLLAGGGRLLEGGAEGLGQHSQVEDRKHLVGGRHLGLKHLKGWDGGELGWRERGVRGAGWLRRARRGARGHGRGRVPLKAATRELLSAQPPALSTSLRCPNKPKYASGALPRACLAPLGRGAALSPRPPPAPELT